MVNKLSTYKLLHVEDAVGTISFNILMTNLRIPGPTPLPPTVLKALSQQMISHRSQEYQVLQQRIIENLQYFFQTKNDIFLLTSSGMGGLEAAIANFFSPQDTIVAFTCGDFGNRWAEIARRYWANLVQISFPPGVPVDKDEVYRVLESLTHVKGVLITLNETSTGILNPMKEIATVVKTHRDKPLLLVDGVSGLGAIDVPMDELEIDVMVTASQKAWMSPPGLAMIAASDAAWERHKASTMPRYYFDLSQFAQFAKKSQTPATPALTALYGLDAALILMKKEGKKKLFQRHVACMRALRQGISRLGLELFVRNEEFASPTVTSIVIPPDVDGEKWRAILKEKYHTIVARGMGETKGKILRVAHMGYVRKDDIDDAITALASSLRDLRASG